MANKEGSSSKVAVPQLGPYFQNFLFLKYLHNLYSDLCTVCKLKRIMVWKVWFNKMHKIRLTSQDNGMKKSLNNFKVFSI